MGGILPIDDHEGVWDAPAVCGGADTRSAWRRIANTAWAGPVRRTGFMLPDTHPSVVAGWTATGLMKANQMTRMVPIAAPVANAMSEGLDKGIARRCDDGQPKRAEFPRLLSRMWRSPARQRLPG